MTEEATPSPLASRVFRALWVATIVSNVGTWMHDVGAGWLMTSLSAEPLMVALVQAATTLPMFLLALPGGALADIVDRRRLLMGAQLFALLATALLAVTTFSGGVTPVLLLSFTCAIACGAALSAPAFQAIVPELVPRAALQQAVALNSLGINIARAIGPALGGLVIALAGPAAVFALNAVSGLGVLLVLARWRRQPAGSGLPAEHFLGALRAGARYAARAPALQVVLVRSIGFFLFASALWALLPIIGRRELGLGPAAYGGLLTLMGLGAVAGAVLLPRLRGHVSANGITAGGSLLFAAAMFGLGHAGGFVAAGAALAVAGLAWIAMMSSLNGAAQMSAPAWVKARALAIYLVTFQGAMTAGSMLWGALAGKIGIPATLMVAAIGMAAVLPLLGFRFRLGAEAALDLSPSLHWPAPIVAGDAPADRGPVMVTIEYRIDPARTAEFLAAMQDMRRIRRRDGAIQWHLLQDAATPDVIVESFMLASWLEHLRQHERVTHADRENQAVVNAFHLGPEPPLVRHLIQPA
ncbi:Predicted arabinose efflux permease, MFS family [Sphingomonas laterariae]|uniref:Predicted arabinose efflux permease, MFS family n=1 Tax=Edaphosphingomonas laterariae TaxID=861865 RepID=A0A239DHR8_9SPHN|nr:MFS transporter [Sphingomonas laterariae]SNS31522.1 Predicted arabinose efflux permease, MFS family [Sphingomonas laterariae]